MKITDLNLPTITILPLLDEDGWGHASPENFQNLVLRGKLILVQFGIELGQQL